jgi:hypothetical protein
MKSVVVVAIVTGLVLVLVGGLWSTFFPPTNSWTPEKAARLSEIKARLNDLSFALQRASRIHSGPDPGTLKAEYDALNKEFDELKHDFETAAERPQVASRILKWAGLSLAALGIIGWYVVNQSG